MINKEIRVVMKESTIERLIIYYRFESLHEAVSIAIDLSMRLAKLGERLACTNLLLSRANRRKYISKCLVTSRKLEYRLEKYAGVFDEAFVELSSALEFVKLFE